VSTGHDWRQAGFVLVIVGALIAVPAALAAVVPTRGTAVGAGEKIELSAPGEAPDTIEFTGIDGWTRRPTGDDTTAVLDGPNRRVLLVNVVNGVTDFDEAARWRQKVLGVQAFDVVTDNEQIGNTHGFSGPTCHGKSHPGVCAVLGNRNLAVSVLLSGQSSMSDLLPVVYSLRAKS
jgi:hypothetical protein